jgi:transcriptional regulator with XRE-family HTH domain
MTSKYDKISPTQAHMDYGFARARDIAFDAVLELWRKRHSAGLTQADLANRLGKDAGWVSKRLRGPGNWTLRTLGELVEALDGELEINVSPLEEPSYPARNFDAYDAAATRSTPKIETNASIATTGSEKPRCYALQGS